MAFVEDVAAFFPPGDPGVVAATIGGSTVYGALETDLAEVLDYPTRSSAPLFRCSRAALPAVAVGATVTVGATVYRVREIAVENFDPIAVLHLNNS